MQPVIGINTYYFLSHLCSAQQILLDRGNNQQALTLPKTDNQELPLSTLQITSNPTLINNLLTIYMP
jgi:hypothetical protein